MAWVLLVQPVLLGLWGLVGAGHRGSSWGQPWGVGGGHGVGAQPGVGACTPNSPPQHPASHRDRVALGSPRQPPRRPHPIQPHPHPVTSGHPQKNNPKTQKNPPRFPPDPLPDTPHPHIPTTLGSPSQRPASGCRVCVCEEGGGKGGVRVPPTRRAPLIGRGAVQNSPCAPAQAAMGPTSPRRCTVYKGRRRSGKGSRKFLLGSGLELQSETGPE